MRLLLMAALAATSLAQNRPADLVRFYGNFPLMVDPTVPISRQPFHFETHHIAEDSNLAAFHMEWFGVPWREFAAGQAPPEAWLREIDAIRGLQQRLGLPAYLALTPIGGSRDRLAPNSTATRPWGSGISTARRTLRSHCGSMRCNPLVPEPHFAESPGHR